MLGSPNAGVTLIEYADPQCPAAVPTPRTSSRRSSTRTSGPGKVDTEFRGFPFIGSDSVKGYRFLLAAAEQNKLWNLQEAMYRNQGGENSGWITDDLIRELASQIPGLDVEKLFADAGSAKITQEAEGANAKAQGRRYPGHADAAQSRSATRLPT